MKTIKLQRGPLLCWDIYSGYLAQQAKNFNRQLELDFLKSLKRQYNLLLDFDLLLENRDFDALVLTNANQEICWVNKGFTKMTGYSTKYAVGKKPNFLQGEATSKTKVDNIRMHIKRGITVKENVINYRKNGEAYHCEIHILPLKDQHQNITHLLALENVVNN